MSVRARTRGRLLLARDPSGERIKKGSTRIKDQRGGTKGEDTDAPGGDDGGERSMGGGREGVGVFTGNSAATPGRPCPLFLRKETGVGKRPGES